MKAVRLHRYGENPEVEDVAEPELTHPLDVTVRIGGAARCRPAPYSVEGRGREMSGFTLPSSLGHESAAWVFAVGPAVDNVAVGDAVIVHPLVTCGLCQACRAGDDMHCADSAFPGISTDGGFAELLKTNARAVVRLDEGLAPADVAALADAGLTAYHAAKKAIPLLYPGTRAVVIGAGGLGHIGVQALKSLTAAEVIVVDRSPEAHKLAESLGADHTVIADGSETEAVKDLTGGVGAEVILDFVGEGGAIESGLTMLRRAGSYFVIGYGGAVHVPAIDIISTEINFVGNLVGTYNDLVELMVLAARGQVNLHTATYPLDAFGDALADLDEGRLRGRGILIPATA